MIISDFWFFVVAVIVVVVWGYFAVGLFLFGFAHFNPQEEFKCSLGFSKIIENSTIEQCWLYRKLYMGERLRRGSQQTHHRRHLIALGGPISMRISSSYLPPLGLFFLPPENH